MYIMSRSTIEDLKARRSVRAFKEDQVKAEDLDAILDAAAYAPSGGKSTVMVAVQDRAVRDKLEELNAAVLKNPDAKPFYGAPTVVAVLGDAAKPTLVEDGSLALGNLQNAAHALRVGSCWIHRAKEVFESPEGKALLDQWGLKGEYRGIGFCVLGYPAGPLPPAALRNADCVIRV
jgi:nitroreductase